MEKIRNHKNYSTALLDFLRERPGASWNDAINFLMVKFNWSQKTSANRLFELRKLNLIRVEGTFTRLEIGKAMKDERILFISDVVLEENNSANENSQATENEVSK